MQILSPIKFFRAPKAIAGPIMVGKADSAYRGYELLYLCYIALPIVAGADKFFNVLTDWTQYLAPVLERWFGEAPLVMRGVGLTEMAVGLLVALNPRIGGVVAAVWLWGAAANLLLLGNFYDIALCDLVMSLGALALSFLASEYDRPGGGAVPYREPAGSDDPPETLQE